MSSLQIQGGCFWRRAAVCGAYGIMDLQHATRIYCFILSRLALAYAHAIASRPPARRQVNWLADLPDECRWFSHCVMDLPLSGASLQSVLPA